MDVITAGAAERGVKTLWFVMNAGFAAVDPITLDAETLEKYRATGAGRQSGLASLQHNDNRRTHCLSGC